MLLWGKRAMALSKSNLLIRDYENIRQILRDSYIFGCFSRDDFIENKGISGRKYDKEQQRINAYLPSKFIQKRRVDKKVLQYCSYNMLDSSNNYLADTYINKSFTALDIMAFFFVQQILNSKEEMTATEILEELPIMNEEVIFTKDNLRIKLEELTEKGFVQCHKIGRKVTYSLSEDIWSNFSNDELVDICTYLEFLKNVSPIEMPYSFLYQKLRLYLRCIRKLDIPEVEIFHFKHNHLFNALDNDILLQIMKTMNKNHILKVEFYGGKPAIRVFPGEIIHDSVYGRQYLYCYELETERNTVIRIDRISSICDAGKFDNISQIDVQAMSRYSDDCWCTSGANDELVEIVIEFSFDEEKESFILRRIKDEGHGGSICKISDNKYEYRLKIKDPNEMIPSLFYTKEWSKKTLGLYYALFKPYDPSQPIENQTKDYRNNNRYYGKVFTFGDSQVLLTCEWYKESKKLYINWFNNLIKSVM